jgi:hypothetical protein
MKVSDYINNYTLIFKIPNAEREYNVMRNEGIVYNNKWFSIFFLISSLLNSIITAVSTEKAYSLGKLFINNVTLISYISLGLGFIFCIISIFIKNIKILKTVGYLIFIGFILPFHNISRVIWEVYLEDKDLFSLLTVFHHMPKIFMMFFQILSFLDCVLVSILEIIIFIIYFYFTNQSKRVSYSVVYMFTSNNL